jgi:hypothetical protein
MWQPWRRAPRLDLVYAGEAGYETEERYREKSEWSVQAAQQLTSFWRARARAGVTDRLEPDGNEARLMTAGIATSFRLSHGTQLSGEYRYAQDETSELPPDAQFRFQLKMKW